MSPLQVKGCNILTYARRSGPLSREGSLSCHTCCDTGLGLSGLIRRTAPFSRLLRHTRECGGSILPRIITGPLSVAFYDTHGDVEDLFYPGSSQMCIEGWTIIYRTTADTYRLSFLGHLDQRVFGLRYPDILTPDLHLVQVSNCWNKCRKSSIYNRCNQCTDNCWNICMK